VDAGSPGAGIFYRSVGAAKIMMTEKIPDRFWIAEFPEAVYQRWERELKTGNQYYLSTTLPYVKGKFGRV
jgi:hypothetical protein